VELARFARYEFPGEKLPELYGMLAKPFK